MSSCTSDSRLLLSPSGPSFMLFSPFSPSSSSLLPPPPGTTQPLSSSIQPGSAGQVLALSYLSASSPPHTVVTLSSPPSRTSPSVLALPPLTSPLDESSPHTPNVTSSSVTTTLSFCGLDSSLVALAETFRSGADAHHRLHLLQVSEEGALELLGSRAVHSDMAQGTAIDGEMDEARELLAAVVNGDEEEEEEEGAGDADGSKLDMEDLLETPRLNDLLRTPRSHTSSLPKDPRAGADNDTGLGSRAFSFAWLPASRSVVSLQYGEVWYWSAVLARTQSASPGFNLDRQDAGDARLKSAPFSAVFASETVTLLPPRRLPSRSAPAPSKSLAPPADLVVVLVSSPPALLRVDTSSPPSLTSTISCPFPPSLTLTCGVVCGEYVLVGTSAGTIEVVSCDTFQRDITRTVAFPNRHREDLDLRMSALKKAKVKAMEKRAKKSAGAKKGRGAVTGALSRSSSASSLHPPCPSPVVRLLVNGPAISRNGASPQIVAEYGDGTTVMHSPFDPPAPPAAPGADARGEAGGKLLSAGGKLLSAGHARSSPLYALAFAPPLHAPRIAGLSLRPPPAAGREPAPVLFSGGGDSSVHVWSLPSTAAAEHPAGGPVPPPTCPLSVLDVPKSVHALMSYRTSSLPLACGTGDHLSACGTVPLHPRDDPALGAAPPRMAVTAVALNNHCSELAVGCADGAVRVYDLTAAAAGKLAYAVDTAEAAVGSVSQSGGDGGRDEEMQSPPVIVGSLGFERGEGSSRNSQYLAVQHTSGWAAVMNRSSCFRGGEVVNECWEEGSWSYAPAVRDRSAPVARLVGDGVDVFSVVNESGGGGEAGGGGKPKHCLVRRMCGAATRDQRLSTMNRGSRGAWTNVTGGAGGGVEDFGSDLVLEGLGAVVRFKSDACIVGAEIHPSEQFVVLLSAKGTVFVYHLWLGEIRGVFPTLLGAGGVDSVFVRGLSVDPWGLYVAVGMGQRGNPGVEEEGGDEPEWGGEGAQSNTGFVDRVEIFEFTTGKSVVGAGEGRVTIAAAAFQWSANGSQIVSVGARGGVDVRAVPAFIAGNLADFKRKIKVNSSFWSTFPLYINVSAGEAAAMSRSGSPLRGTMSRGSTPQAGMSRQQSKAGFSLVSEMSASELGVPGGGDDLRGIPKMQPAEGLMGNLMNKDASKSTLFGRHSSASSPTA